MSIYGPEVKEVSLGVTVVVQVSDGYIALHVSVWEGEIHIRLEAVVGVNRNHETRKKNSKILI